MAEINHIQIKIEDFRSIDLNCKIKVDIPVKKQFGFENKMVEKDRQFKLDTGATHTCLNASDLGIILDEQEFVDMMHPETLQAKGIDDKIVIKFYKMQVENFIINNIDLGSVPVYITFSNRVTKRLLGMNILRLLNIGINCDKSILYLEKTKKFMEYKKNNLRIKAPEMLDIQQTNGDVIIVDEFGVELSDEEIEKILFKEYQM